MGDRPEWCGFGCVIWLLRGVFCLRLVLDHRGDRCFVASFRLDAGEGAAFTGDPNGAVECDKLRHLVSDVDDVGQ